MAFSPQVGDTGRVTWTVERAHTADAMGNPGVLVFATPMMLDLVEVACGAALERGLPSDWVSLGTWVTLSHRRPTPLGMRVTAEATITAVDGPRVRFQVVVRDEVEVVGEAEHERYCLPRTQFEAMVEKKRNRT
ncbi:MAG: thioesterase [Actinomycetia bacterium]|nr:thioesterase [Actinomycetes bacterium]